MFDDVVPVVPKTNKRARRSSTPFVLEERKDDDKRVTDWFRTANVDQHNVINVEKRTRSEVRGSI